MNNNDFKDIINILKIIAPHSKKFNNDLLSKYTNKKFKFRELIKQLNKITINQKNSKNRNLILNIDDVILKKLEEFLLSGENSILDINDIINKIVKLNAEIERKKEKEILEKKNKIKEKEQEEEEEKLKTQQEEREKVKKDKQDKEKREREEKEKKEKQEKQEKEEKDKKEREQKEREQKEKEKQEKNKDNKINEKQKENKIKNILEQNNIKTNIKDEKFVDKILNNKEKIKTAKETFTKFNIQNPQQAKDKIDILNQKVNSLKMTLSIVKNSAMANIIMAEINNLSSQMNELKDAVSIIIDNEISR